MLVFITSPKTFGLSLRANALAYSGVFGVDQLVAARSTLPGSLLTVTVIASHWYRTALMGTSFFDLLRQVKELFVLRYRDDVNLSTLF